MPVTLVSVRHKTTGRKVVIPQEALRLFPDYEKTAQQVRREDIPDGTAFPAEATADPVSVPAPARNASKDAWVDYAVATGATREDAESLSRDELADLYAPSTNDAARAAEES